MNSHLWEEFKVHKLSKNMRVERLIGENTSPERADKLREHTKWVLNMGNGSIEGPFKTVIDIPTNMMCVDAETPEEKVYDNFAEDYKDKERLLGCVSRTSTNDTLCERNFKLIDKKIPGDMRISYSRDECLEDDDKQMYGEHFLNRVNVSGLPPHRLPLKKEVVLILIKIAT